MPYAPVDPGRIGPGMPLDPSNLEALYRGVHKTNGFVMRSADGRVPVLRQPLGRLKIDPASVLSDDGVVPWGNALWRNIARMKEEPGTACAQKPAKAFLCGVLEFNQGWQAGHPVMPHGLPDYSRGAIITKGFVGYKTAMPAVGGGDNYLAYLKGDATKNVPAVRTTYAQWLDAYQAAAVTDGSRLGLFFENETGFPVVSVVAPANITAPVLTGATFAGFAIVWEKENEAVFFDIDL